MPGVGGKLCLGLWFRHGSGPRQMMRNRTEPFDPARVLQVGSMIFAAKGPTMTIPTEPVLTLFAAVSAAHHAAQRLIEARLPKGMSAAQFAVLERLARLGEGQTPVSVAQAFGWPKTSMSHTLAVLESRGLLRLEPNPRDGRSKCLWLTPKGRTIAALGMTAVEGDLINVASVADQAEIAQLQGDMESLAARLSDLRRFPM